MRILAFDGTGGDQWLDLALMNGFSNFDAAIWGPAQYRRIGNQVHLRGLVNTGANPSATLAILPAGFRPTRTVFLGVPIQGTGFRRLDVDTAGQIAAAENPTANTYMGLCVSFFID